MAPRDFTNAKTSVFLDVDDFPMPSGDDRSYYNMIKSALEKEDYRGEVSISAYGEKEPGGKLGDGIKFVTRKDKRRRLHRMLLDIMFWTLDNPMRHVEPINVMVIAKNIPDEIFFVYICHHLKDIGYHVLLVLPEDCEPERVPVPEVNKAWYWKSLLKAENAMEKSELHTLAWPNEVCVGCVEYPRILAF